MFTSRAEYRILLRQDNADIRLTPIAHALGVRNMDDRMQRVLKKKEEAAAIRKYLENKSIQPQEVDAYLKACDTTPLKQGVKLDSIVLRPEVSLEGLMQALPEVGQHLMQFDEESLEQAEINLKYEGYIKREEEMVKKMERLESVQLGDHYNYDEMNSLSAEAREKLNKHKPMTIGQASRISGVTPADVSVLLVHAGR
jgi:tRNA uridine 5-carboxymethylaminomethyl modification enzyme